MSPRIFQCLLLVSLTYLVAGELRGLLPYFFKREPPKNLKEKVFHWSSVYQDDAWCSEACDAKVCRMIEKNGKFNLWFSDCDCGLHCHCLYTGLMHNVYVYKCMPAF
ncbi:hypothetical protein AWC38_SpisGene4271 [Stylophora pistillata]|uniref:Uncharacterized protein n=1 Tax=Stylophora pistillata TaxID=50429 RepID=A0A2B4SQZ1_STYPI|nr:hypothetical protein AWC38_SpisGene4271 [Stylophora pistillata]